MRIIFCHIFNHIFPVGFLGLFCLISPSMADEFEFAGYEARFKNFCTCELTRTGANPVFGTKPFEITMIDVFSIKNEGDLTVVSGAIQCSVKGKFHFLYAALGIENLRGRDQVAYYTLRKKDFSILATELMKFPYKERCPWARYWVDTH